MICVGNILTTRSLYSLAHFLPRCGVVECPLNPNNRDIDHANSKNKIILRHNSCNQPHSFENMDVDVTFGEESDVQAVVNTRSINTLT